MNNGETTTYTYNHAGQMTALTKAGIARGPYRHNAFGLLAWKQSTAGSPSTRVHLVYDFDGNLLVEADGTTGGTIREYIWLNGRPDRP